MTALKEADSSSNRADDHGSRNGSRPASPMDQQIRDDKDDKDALPRTDPGTEPPHQYAEGFRLASIVTSLSLVMFCLGLDKSILATAIPKITAEFNSLDDIAWYGSAFTLTICSFQLTFGKLYAEFRVTWVYLAALGLFEVGSVICAAAPNSIALILGRAISGIGCAGVLSGGFIIIAHSLPLQKRPIYTSLVGGVAGIAQVIAPTIGGALTDNASWRWCFWINLPVGAIAAVVVLIFIRIPATSRAEGAAGLWAFLVKIDLLGTLLFIPCIVCLLLALQWGGVKYGWNSWRIILCFVLFGVLFLSWCYQQYRQGDKATMPLRLLRQRSVAGGIIFSLGLGGSIYIVLYFIPIWFQAVKNTSAEQSGINFLAVSASMTVAGIATGGVVSKIGYYVPLMIFCTVVCSIASGLIYRYEVDTSAAYWAGTLVMHGFGAGVGLQIPVIAVQTVLEGADIALAVSVILLFQTLSAAIFLAVGNGVFQTSLVAALKDKVPDVDSMVVVEQGASGVKDAMMQRYGPENTAGVLQAYNSAVRECFLVGIVLCCITIVGVLLMEWKSVKAKKVDEPSNQTETSGSEK